MLQSQPTPDTRPETRYVTVSTDTWSLIRGAYLSGLSARTVAGRFGVSEGALLKRAAREGWTKRAFAGRATARGHFLSSSSGERSETGGPSGAAKAAKH